MDSWSLDPTATVKTGFIVSCVLTILHFQIPFVKKNVTLTVYHSGQNAKLKIALTKYNPDYIQIPD